eukprot:3620624-Amphidinium_carterae.1
MTNTTFEYASSDAHQCPLRGLGASGFAPPPVLTIFMGPGQHLQPNELKRSKQTPDRNKSTTNCAKVTGAADENFGDKLI